MRLLIVEPDATGHHMASYTRLIVGAALRRGWTPHLLTTRTSTQHPSFRIVEVASEGKLRVHLMPNVPKPALNGSLALLGNQLRRFLAIRAGFRRISPSDRPDRIYVVNLDHCDKIMSVIGSPFGGVPFSGMMMSPKFHRDTLGIGPPGRSDAVYEWFFRRLLRFTSLRKVAVIDRAFLEYADRSEFEEYAKLVFVPDPGDLRGAGTQDEARRSLGIDPQQFLVLVYGSLTLRKGIRELIRAVASCKGGPVAVLLAGTPDSAIAAMLREPVSKGLMEGGQLFVRSGFLSVEQEYRVFRAADAVWVGYVDGFYGSSGVFYQAGSLGIPVLASRLGLLGWLVERHASGLCIDPSSAADVVDAINRLLSDAELRQRLGENGRRLAQTHTGDRFGDAVCATV